MPKIGLSDPNDPNSPPNNCPQNIIDGYRLMRSQTSPFYFCPDGSRKPIVYSCFMNTGPFAGQCTQEQLGVPPPPPPPPPVSCDLSSIQIGVQIQPSSPNCSNYPELVRPDSTPTSNNPRFKTPGNISITVDASNNILIDNEICDLLVLKRGVYTFSWDDCTCNTPPIIHCPDDAPLCGKKYFDPTTNTLNLDANYYENPDISIESSLLPKWQFANDPPFPYHSKSLRDFLSIKEDLSITYSGKTIPIKISLLDGPNGSEAQYVVVQGDAYSISPTASETIDINGTTYNKFSTSESDVNLDFTNRVYDPADAIVFITGGSRILRGSPHILKYLFSSKPSDQSPTVSSPDNKILTNSGIPTNDNSVIAWPVIYYPPNVSYVQFRTPTIIYPDCTQRNIGSEFPAFRMRDFEMSRIRQQNIPVCDLPTFSPESPSFAFLDDTLTITAAGSNICSISCTFNPSNFSSNTRTFTQGSGGGTTNFIISNFAKDNNTYTITVTLTNATGQQTSQQLTIVNKRDIVFTNTSTTWNNTTQELTINYTVSDGTVACTTLSTEASINPGTNSFIVRGLIPGNSYSFNLNATNDSSRGNNSKSVSVTFNVPRDCSLSPWIDSPTPALACGTSGTRQQTKTVLVPSANGGQACGPTSQTITVQAPACPPPIRPPAPTPVNIPAPAPVNIPAPAPVNIPAPAPMTAPSPVTRSQPAPVPAPARVQPASAPGMVPFSPPGFMNWYTSRKETDPITFTKRSNNSQISVKYVYDVDGRGWRQIDSSQTSFFNYAVNFTDKSATLTYQDTGKILQTKMLPS